MGLLLVLSLLSLALALLLHHLSRLPSSYTWLEPIRTLRSVLAGAHVPAAIVLVYALGRWSQRGAWDVQAIAARWARPMQVRDTLKALLRPAQAACFVLVVDHVLLGAERDMLDLSALLVIAWVIAGHRPSQRQLSKEVLYASFSALVFLVICYCFTILKALTFLHGRRLDADIIALEHMLCGSVPHRVLALWATTHPRWVELCDWVYFHFFEHMALTTVLLVALRMPSRRTEYLGALALCYVLGGPIYQLFPAQGPSYFEPRSFLFLANPDLTVFGVRGWLEFNTHAVANGTATEVRTWGYIACMPSLHVAQELVMLYYSRGSRWAFCVSLAFTLLTLLAVVVLGFHYPLDSLAGAGVAALAIAIARWQKQALMPAALRSAADQAPIASERVLVPFLKAYAAARRRGASEP